MSVSRSRHVPHYLVSQPRNYSVLVRPALFFKRTQFISHCLLIVTPMYASLSLMMSFHTAGMIINKSIWVLCVCVLYLWFQALLSALLRSRWNKLIFIFYLLSFILLLSTARLVCRGVSAVRIEQALENNSSHLLQSRFVFVFLHSSLPCLLFVIHLWLLSVFILFDLFGRLSIAAPLRWAG